LSTSSELLSGDSLEGVTGFCYLVTSRTGATRTPYLVATPAGTAEAAIDDTS